MAFSFTAVNGIGILTIPAFTRTGLVKHAFTTRHRGFSRAPYASLNMALHVGDDQQAVIWNRRQVCAALGWIFPFWWPLNKCMGRSRGHRD